MLIKSWSALAALFIFAVPATAQQNTPQSPLVDALDRCRTTAEATARLACFERTAEELITAAKSGSISVVDRNELRRTRRSLFGFSTPRLPFFAGDRSAEDERDELESTIKSARSLGYGKYVVRITDGDALWETTEGYSSMSPPKAGQNLIIRRGSLGSYMVRFGRERWVQARRVG